MEFFKQLFEVSPDADLTIRIMGKNGKYTISVTPSVKEAKIAPLIVTGTPDELDKDFVQVIKAPLKEAAVTIQNLTAYQESLKEAGAKTKTATKATADNKKEVEKAKSKPAAKKADKPKDKKENEAPEEETKAPEMETPAPNLRDSEGSSEQSADETKSPGIVEQTVAAAQERKCRVCGCTQNDCRQCIEKTGQPCSWVEDDLCSACVEENEEEPVETLPSPEPAAAAPEEKAEEPAAQEQPDSPEAPAPEVPEAPKQKDIFSFL